MTNLNSMRYIDSFQSRTKNVLAMISNCDQSKVGHRNKWVDGLMEAGLEIDHYGACSKWKNREEDMSLGKDSQGIFTLNCIIIICFSQMFENVNGNWQSNIDS